jgi:hypothetical protein
MLLMDRDLRSITQLSCVIDCNSLPISLINTTGMTPLKVSDAIVIVITISNTIVIVITITIALLIVWFTLLKKK